jgi:hypothetical protein
VWWQGCKSQCAILWRGIVEALMHQKWKLHHPAPLMLLLDTSNWLLQITVLHLGSKFKIIF